ncbi:hypothetical protein D3C73_1249760 [compost metagenome]
MQHRCRQASQFTGFIQPQQWQQAGIFYLTRIGAVHPGHVAPNGHALRTGQRADLGSGIVTAVTPQQHGFTGVVA